jgi:hypothetical protein
MSTFECTVCLEDVLPTNATTSPCKCSFISGHPWCMKMLKKMGCSLCQQARTKKKPSLRQPKITTMFKPTVKNVSFHPR